MGKLFENATGAAGKFFATGVLAATTAVSGAADEALNFVIHPASAADTFPAAVSNVAATTQQVFDEIQTTIPKDANFFKKLSPEGKSSVAFFYQNFKETKDPKNLSEALRQMTYLQLGYEINKQAFVDLEKNGRISGEGIEDPSDAISALLNMPTYKALLSPNTQVGQIFWQFRAQAEWTYSQAESLQTKLHSTDAEVVRKAKLELAAAKKALEESERRLAASREERTVTRVELAKAKKKNHRLRETEQQMDALAAAAKR